MNNSISNIANKYLQNLSYQIDSKTFELQLTTHPEYPSFISICDTFDYFEVDNIAADVPLDVLDDLPNSFITIVEVQEKQSLCLIEKKNDKILITNENLETEKLTVEYFKTIWSGKIIVIEEQLKQSKGKINFKFENVLVFLLSLSICFLNINNLTFQFCAYTLLSIAGVLVSIFITKEALGLYSKSMTKVCEKLSKTNGCKGVINSLDSKFFQQISLSDACILYFVSNLIAILILGFDESLFLLFAMVSLPIVLFSIYYQGIILKQWCALCLGISTILVLQFSVVLYDFESFKFDLNFTIKYLFLTLTVYIVWKNLKILIQKSIKLSKIEVDFLKFKRNSELFKAMLQKTVLVDQSKKNSELSISFGSTSPILIITAVTNPFCGFCVESFKVYEKLLAMRTDIAINFIFSVSNDFRNQDTQIVITVLDIYFNQSKKEAFESLSLWYNNRDLKIWSNKYLIKADSTAKFKDLLIQNNTWMIDNNINYTPATFIDNYLFPKSYNIEDLLLFVDDLVHEKKDNS